MRKYVDAKVWSLHTVGRAEGAKVSEVTVTNASSSGTKVDEPHERTWDCDLLLCTHQALGKHSWRIICSLAVVV